MSIELLLMISCTLSVHKNLNTNLYMQNINNVLVRDEHLTSFLNRKVCKKYNHMYGH